MPGIWIFAPKIVIFFYVEFWKNFGVKIHIKITKILAFLARKFKFTILLIFLKIEFSRQKMQVFLWFWYGSYQKLNFHAIKISKFLARKFKFSISNFSKNWIFGQNLRFSHRVFVKDASGVEIVFGFWISLGNSFRLK